MLNSENDNISSIRSKYLQWVVDRTLYVNILGAVEIDHQVPVKLTQAYISLYAEHASHFDMTDQDAQERYQEVEKISKKEHFPLKNDSSLQEDALAEPEKRMKVGDVVNQFSCLVLLGDPGSGKTTQLHYLAHQHAQALLSHSAQPQQLPGSPRFPILLRIADYAKDGLSQKLTLSDFLAQACILYHCPPAGLEDLLATALAQEDCLILLDGLDEVFDAQVHSKVVEQIRLFVSSHSHRPHHFLITSRPTGYSLYPLGAPCVHYRLCDMNEAQIHQFLASWCQAVETAQAPELPASLREASAHQEVEGILQAIETSPSLQLLAPNPLILRIIALIHRVTNKLPHKRVELYRLAATILTRNWRRYSGSEESSPMVFKEEDTFFDSMLSFLAFWIHTHRLEGLVTEKEVHQILREEWMRIQDINTEEDDPAFAEEVTGFLHRVRNRAGLLVERAPGQYGFLHHSFQEYYAGRYLVKNSNMRAQRIYERRHKPRWEEPILLGLGFVGLTSLEDASALLETAILAQGKEAREQGFAHSPDEDILGQDFLFALRCLGEQISLRLILERRLIKQFIDELICQRGFAKFQLYHQQLWQRLEGLRASRAVQDRVVQMLSVGTTEERLNAISAIEKLGFTSEKAVNELADAFLHSGEGDLSRQAAMCLALLGSEKALRILVQALDSNGAESSVRTAAAESLGCVKEASPELINILVTTLSDGDSEVQHRSAKSLGQLRLPEEMVDQVVEALMKALDGKNANLNCAAARSLGHLGQVSSEVVDALIKTALSSVLHAQHDSPKIDMGIAAIESLGQLGHASDRAKIADTLHTILDHVRYRQRPEVRYAAVQSLGQLGLKSDEIVKDLLKELGCGYARVQEAAAKSLGMIKPESEDVVKALLRGRNRKVSWVYVAQIESLGKLEQVPNPNHVVKRLLVLLGNEASNIRRAAGQSLRQLGQTSEDLIVQELLHILDDSRSDRELRCAAVQSLGQLGQTLKGQTFEQIQQAFLKVLKNDVPSVRFAVARTLTRFRNANMPKMAKNALYEFLEDEQLSTRFQAAEGLMRLKLVSDQIIGVFIEVLLLRTADAPLRRDAAILLGEQGTNEDRVILALWDGFRNTVGYLRSACIVGLAQFVRRFPEHSEEIATKLREIIKNDDYATEIDARTNRSIQDYAFEALWLLRAEIAASE